MTCREKIMSEDYVDYIWKGDSRLLIPYLQSMGICAQYINQDFITLYVDRASLGAAQRLLVGDYALPGCHTLLNPESLEQTGILAIQNQPALGLKGTGVIIGFMDSGIALENDVFRTEDGKTRVLELWDQTDQTGTPPEDIQFGSVYTAEQIDTMLAEGRTDLPGADQIGHGTKVAAIAAGSESEDGQFFGAAPEAQIAFVKLKQAKAYTRQIQQIPQNVVAYEESDIMLAIRYLDMLATRENKPLVICIALGSNTGGHTGSTPLGIYLNEFARSVGRAAVVAAGNEGNQGHHFFGVVPSVPGYLDVELRVGEEEEKEGFQLNLWGNAPGIFSAQVISPSGEVIPRSYHGTLDRRRYDFVFETTVLDVQYELSEFISGDERLLFTFRKPTQGVWRLRIFASGNLENSFHMWLPVSDFISPGTYFLRPDPNTTVTEPGNADYVLTMGGYDSGTFGIWLDSSRGYTRNNEVKPDLVAPAVNVQTVDRFGNPATLMGTSASAAVGAGACVLLMEWGIVRQNAPTMDGVIIQRFLIRGAKRPGTYKYPNQSWGYGILDLYGGFQALRNMASGG
ncbi:MAG TPA: peptidase [Lachnospiraceae bacterium]|nr:peptidase [Lachnospiraceae bacterium]